MKILIIPARSGSKRIKNKNIRKFNGKPIILHTIDLILSFKFFDKIFVSTDSIKIKKILKDYKVEIISRPKKLANDYSSTYDVMQHAISHINYIKYKFLYCIYPTSIFIKKEYLTYSYLKINKSKIDYIFSAKKTNSPIEKNFTVNRNKVYLFNNKVLNNLRTQDMTISYVDAAQFYLGTKEAWSNKKNIYNSNSIIFKVTDWKIIDIDDINDWKLAELIMKKNNNLDQKKDLGLINKIESIRSTNNINWMDILRIAIKHSPDETKKILKNINDKDNKISKIVKKLSK